MTIDNIQKFSCVSDHFYYAFIASHSELYWVCVTEGMFNLLSLDGFAGTILNQIMDSLGALK